MGCFDHDSAQKLFVTSAHTIIYLTHSRNARARVSIEYTTNESIDSVQ